VERKLREQKQGVSSSIPKYYIRDMNHFINREAELAQLENQYRLRSASLVVLYGRRRLGKTCLLRQFAIGKPHCYFMADRAGEPDLRRSLARAMALALEEPTLGRAEYASWYDLFAAFDRVRPSGKRFVLIFDEYQYLCQVQPAFSSFLQKWWDEHWHQGELLLILCGSVTSMIYKETLAASAPLYGRSSAQLLLRPMDFSHLSAFLPGKTGTELVEFFTLTGGVPRYLDLAANYPSFKAALTALVLHPDGILHNEARQLLQEEIQTPNQCWSILHAIGSGANRISEIAGRTGQPANKLTRYLDLLKDLHLVRRETPVLERNPARSKKGIYVVSDPFCRLWFGAIYPYTSFFEFAETEPAYSRIEPIITKLVAERYEEVCRQWIRARAMEFNAVSVGRQWSSAYEIDVAAVNPEGELTVVGECKWSDHKLGADTLSELKRKVISHKLPVAENCQYVLFSKAGFTAELENLAGDHKRIILTSGL
jgi:AAA+ ATPase superfamily predicted ATPase